MSKQTPEIFYKSKMKKTIN
uniref:Uncharacterized protein n=1 Tax=Romanomermis culicivorax TaxID=13658 RepID=A0A915IKD5_ROMCU